MQHALSNESTVYGTFQHYFWSYCKQEMVGLYSAIAQNKNDNYLLRQIMYNKTQANVINKVLCCEINFKHSLTVQLFMH